MDSKQQERNNNRINFNNKKKHHNKLQTVFCIVDIVVHDWIRSENHLGYN